MTRLRDHVMARTKVVLFLIFRGGVSVATYVITAN